MKRCVPCIFFCGSASEVTVIVESGAMVIFLSSEGQRHVPRTGKALGVVAKVADVLLDSTVSGVGEVAVSGPVELPTTISTLAVRFGLA